MSSDNGYVIQQKDNGKYVCQHYFGSDDFLPNPDYAVTEFNSVEDAIAFFKDVAADAEYGFKIIHRDPPVTQETPSFHEELTHLLNKHSMETRSNTPDFILAEFMTGALKAYESAVQYRDALPTLPPTGALA